MGESRQFFIGQNNSRHDQGGKYEVGEYLSNLELGKEEWLFSGGLSLDPLLQNLDGSVFLNDVLPTTASWLSKCEFLSPRRQNSHCIVDGLQVWLRVWSLCGYST